MVIAFSPCRSGVAAISLLSRSATCTRRFPLDIRKHDRKLFPAQSSEQIVGAHAAAKQGDDMLQPLVPDEVSVPIVDRFEMVDVEHEHGDD